jgi:hypothetical protein
MPSVVMLSILIPSVVVLIVVVLIVVMLSVVMLSGITPTLHSNVVLRTKLGAYPYPYRAKTHGAP